MLASNLSFLDWQFRLTQVLICSSLNLNAENIMTFDRPPIHFTNLPADPEVLRIIAVGSPRIVENYILTQYRLGYAEVREWSRLLPSPNPGEAMRILTKRVALATDDK